MLRLRFMILQTLIGIALISVGGAVLHYVPTAPSPVEIAGDGSVRSIFVRSLWVRWLPWLVGAIPILLGTAAIMFPWLIWAADVWSRHRK